MSSSAQKLYSSTAVRVALTAVCEKQVEERSLSDLHRTTEVFLCVSAQIQEQPLHYLHLATLREYLRFDFADLTGLDVSTDRARISFPFLSYIHYSLRMCLTCICALLMDLTRRNISVDCAYRNILSCHY